MALAYAKEKANDINGWKTWRPIVATVGFRPKADILPRPADERSRFWIRVNRLVGGIVWFADAGASTVAKRPDLRANAL
jgi:hypothetical protein